MVRLRLVLVLAVLSYAAVVEAQQATFSGMITAHLGAAHGGDVRERAITPGASMAVIDDHGLGVEIDVSHTRNYDDVLFDESGVTAAMLNVVGMYPHPSIRPFVVVGVGLLRTSGTIFEGQPAASRTDTAFSLGGGLLYMFDELVGVRGDMRYFRYFQERAELPQSSIGAFDFWRTSIGVTLAWPIR